MLQVIMKNEEVAETMELLPLFIGQEDFPGALDNVRQIATEYCQ